MTEKASQHLLRQGPPLLLVAARARSPTQETPVFDFTMGSGTTGVAGAQAGRAFVGIERDGSYFEIARDRISSAAISSTRRADLFDN